MKTNPKPLVAGEPRRPSDDSPGGQAAGLARPAGGGARRRPQARRACRDRLLGRSAGTRAPVRSRARRATQGPAGAHAPALGQSAGRRLPLPVRGTHLRPLSRRPASPRSCATWRSRPDSRCISTRRPRFSRGEGDMAARIDDPQFRLTPPRHWARCALATVRAQRALLRDSRLRRPSPKKNSDPRAPS